MSLLSADDLHLALGGRPILSGASFALERRDRLGVIGRNGSGKSTLLRVLAGEILPDLGRVVRARGSKLGYLAQEIDARSEGKLLESVLAKAPGLRDIEARIEELEEALASEREDLAQVELAAQLAELHSEKSDLAQRFAPHRAQRILAGLGFSDSDFGRPLSTFSGGWRMRAALGGLLFQAPDVLLLDEPTNHLDLPSVAWLNRFLRSFPHAILLICHDREFLNQHVSRVLSFEPEGLRSYRGNYEQYKKQRAADLELLKNRAKKDEQRKKELESFVERFRAKNTKARQAQSKVKQIEKMMERQVDVPKAQETVAIHFDPVERTGNTVISVSGAQIRYGERVVLEDIDLAVQRGQRIAIVGVNGAGKTSLLRLIAGEIHSDPGRIELGHKVDLRYFAQHHSESLNPSATVLDEVWRSAPQLSQTAARSLCGAFLFSGDEVDKPISVLSGGEKTRVALARLLAAPGNVLLLDEPTNHLDTESAEQLTSSLESYDGTLVFVSHNLDFARRLSNTVWDVRGGRVETYPGSLADYLEDQELRAAEIGEDSSAPEEAPVREEKSLDKAARKEARRLERQSQAEDRKIRARLRREIELSESRIAELEREQSEIEQKLSDPGTQADPEKARAIALRYQALLSESEGELRRWEQLSEEAEAMGGES